MTSSPRPFVRHCPVCGVAMQATKSDEKLPRDDTFLCLTCNTTIVEKPRARGGEEPSKP